MKSYIFRCNTKTKDEVFQRMLLGEEEGVWGTMSQIKPDDFLFLYNPSSSEIQDTTCLRERYGRQAIPFTKIQHIIKKYRNDIYPYFAIRFSLIATRSIKDQRKKI